LPRVGLVEQPFALRVEVVVAVRVNVLDQFDERDSDRCGCWSKSASAGRRLSWS
jgi:hypothetical protein